MSYKGSPPLARGIPMFLSQISQSNGITPARAGNTQILSQKILLNWDHPRSRGEYPFLPPPDIYYRGSPPLARGIPSCKASRIFLIGITPARAGNTHSPSYFYFWAGDHPRSRGEYLTLITL